LTAEELSALLESLRIGVRPTPDGWVAESEDGRRLHPPGVVAHKTPLDAALGAESEQRRAQEAQKIVPADQWESLTKGARWMVPVENRDPGDAAPALLGWNVMEAGKEIAGPLSREEALVVMAGGSPPIEAIHVKVRR
jgi:hypothetical protein